MQRSLYCTLELLNQTQSFNSKDWRLRVLSRLCAIYIPYEDLRGWFPTLAFSEHDTVESILNCLNKRSIPEELEFEEYYEKYDDYTQLHEFAQCGFEEKNASVLEVLRDSFGDILKIAPEVKTELFYNGALCGENVDSSFFKSQGILTIDEQNDYQFKVFKEGWYENPNPHEKNTSFSWMSFYGDGFAEQYTSNSVVIIDRYLFQTKKKNPDGYLNTSVKELIDILNSLIPKSFSETYYATIVFEYEQLVWDNNWKNERPVAECLKNICNCIISELNYKNVQISFVAIKDPHKQVDSPKTQKWYTLHRDYFHDRKIITNYSWTIASAALNATTDGYSSKNKTVSRFQTIAFYPLFDRIDNPRQKHSEIPFFKIDSFINDFIDLIKAVPFCAYECYKYNNRLKQIKKGKEELIENNLLDFRQ